MYYIFFPFFPTIFKSASVSLVCSEQLFLVEFTMEAGDAEVM